MSMKQLRAGQIFTLYGVIWQVQKSYVDPCYMCQLNNYWWNHKKADPSKDPCIYMCGGKYEKLPINCNAKLLSK